MVSTNHNLRIPVLLHHSSGMRGRMSMTGQLGDGPARKGLAVPQSGAWPDSPGPQVVQIGGERGCELYGVFERGVGLRDKSRCCDVISSPSHSDSTAISPGQAWLVSTYDYLPTILLSGVWPYTYGSACCPRALTVAKEPWSSLRVALAEGGRSATQGPGTADLSRPGWLASKQAVGGRRDPLWHQTAT